MPVNSWLDTVVAFILRPRFALSATAILLLAGILTGTGQGHQLAHHDTQMNYLASIAPHTVRVAVKNLPEDLREAIVLCEWEERSVAEAATILEATPKTVESRLYRARGILRKRLKSWL